MKKIKFNLPSWDTGRKFIDEIVSSYDTSKYERNGDLKIDDPRFEITCHFNADRGTSFIFIRLHEEKLEPELINLKSKYSD